MIRIGYIGLVRSRRKPSPTINSHRLAAWRSLASSDHTNKPTNLIFPSAPEENRNPTSRQDDSRTSLLSKIIRKQRILTQHAGDSGSVSKRTDHQSLRPFRLSPAPQLADTAVHENGLGESSENSAAGTATNAFGTAPRDDLFDVFQIPEPPTPVAPRVRGPNSFPEESVNQYWEILESVLSDPKAQRKNTHKEVPDEIAIPAFDWLRSEEPAVEIDLPTFSRALNDGVDALHGGNDSDSAGQRAFKEEVSRQRERFCQKMGLTQKQVQLAEGALYQVSNRCAKFAKGLPMDVIWHKVKESGIVSQNFLHNMLYVSGTFSAASLSARNKRQSKYGHLTGVTSILDALDPLPEEEKTVGAADSGINFVDMVDEIAIYHDLLYTPTEQSINVRVKLLVAQGKATEAENLLDANASSETALRLRGYLPVLRLYLELGDLSSAMRLYSKMRKMSTVHLDVETYMHVISGIAERGVFVAENSEPIDGATSLGYENAAGPGLFDELCTEMASEIIELPEASGKKLYNALARGFPGSNLTETTSLEPLRITNDRVVSNDLFVGRVRVDPATGVCPRTGVKLRLIHLEESQREKLVSSLMSLATSRQSKFEEKRESHVSLGVPAHEKLMEFYQWLDQRDGEPFTTLVDGANVGYYQQNFESGRFSYHQIKFVVDSLESKGENVLVVLPAKYTKDYFRLSSTNAGYSGSDKQRLTKEEKAIRNWLTKNKKIASIPQGYLDDFYWILASVSPQTKARRGRDISVEPGNPEGRWPGTRPVLITNDQMRDHQIELLEPMLFRRWFSNYIVNYNFAPFVNGRSTHPEIGFSPADFFSREIQGNTDDNGSTVWHFPIAGEACEWFCVRIPLRQKAACL